MFLNVEKCNLYAAGMLCATLVCMYAYAGATTLKSHPCVDKWVVWVWHIWDPMLLSLCNLCLPGIFHGQALNCYLLGEVVKGNWTLLSLAAASLFPQLKLLNSPGCALWYCRAHCPKARALSFFLATTFPEYAKREIAANRKWPLAAMDAFGSHLSATYGNLMEKHTMAHWNISSFQLSCCKKTQKKHHNTSSIVCSDKRWKVFLCTQRRHTRQGYQ